MTTAVTFWSGSVADLAALRTTVLGWSSPMVARDELPGAVHCVARPAGRPGPVVAGCSAAPLSLEGDVMQGEGGGLGWHLYGCAVDAAWQGRGVGAAVVEALVEDRPPNTEVIWARARLSALGFWAHLGFDAVGEVFVEHLNGQREQVVVRYLP